LIVFISSTNIVTRIGDQNVRALTGHHTTLRTFLTATNKIFYSTNTSEVMKKKDQCDMKQYFMILFILR